MPERLSNFFDDYLDDYYEKYVERGEFVLTQEVKDNLAIEFESKFSEFVDGYELIDVFEEDEPAEYHKQKQFILDWINNNFNK